MADNGFLVRDLTTEDIPQARALMLRTVAEDFGDPYDPAVHADIDDMAGWYLAPVAPFMLVAEDRTTGELLATAGIRGGALKEGLSPPHLVERYSDGRTGQLVRVYVLREHRRRGIARVLIQRVLDRAWRAGHYDTIALHTFPHSPGALAFWQSVGSVVVEDDTAGVSRALFMEIPLETLTIKERNTIMTKRRDVFIFVSEPGKIEQAQDYLGEFLRSLDGHPGYLGGSVLTECAKELLPGTLVLLMEFESTEAARALWPKIENTVNPLYPDDKSDKSPDQGMAFFDGTGGAVADGAPLPLKFSRGNGMLARMLHVHAAAVDEFVSA